VAAGLIRAFNKYPWTAIKITSHRHEGVFAPAGNDGNVFCDIYEEVDRDGDSDTSRLLAAGASRALWVRIGGEFLDASLQPLLPILQSSPFAMIESNRILRVIQPDLFIMVLRYDIEDFKESARAALEKAHAVVVVKSNSALPQWKGIPAEILSGIPQFAMSDPQSIPAGLLDFVAMRLPR